MDYDGNVLVPLDEAELAHIGASLKEAGVEAVIVSFLHAYANTATKNESATSSRRSIPAGKSSSGLASSANITNSSAPARPSCRAICSRWCRAMRNR